MGWMRRIGAWGRDHHVIAVIYVVMITVIVAAAVIGVGVAGPVTDWWIFLGSAAPAGVVSAIALLSVTSDADPSHPGRVSHPSLWPRLIEAVTWAGVVITLFLTVIGLGRSEGAAAVVSHLTGFVAGMAAGVFLYFIAYSAARAKQPAVSGAPDEG